MLRCSAPDRGLLQWALLLLQWDLLMQWTLLLQYTLLLN